MASNHRTEGGPGGCTPQLALLGRVLWAGLYWAGRFPWWHDQSDQGSAAPDIALKGPGADYQQVTATEADDLTGPYGRPSFVAFADVTNLIAQYGSGVWSAASVSELHGNPDAEALGASRPVDSFGRGGAGEQSEPDNTARPANWDWGDHGEFGWTLVVVTTDPSAAPGTQVMVLDGAHEIDAENPSFSVPLDALPPGRQANIHTVTWARGGPQIDAFPQDLAESPAVTFTSGNTPYLAGLVAVTDPPRQ